jgi:histidinol-phosphate aminotransferase
MAKKNCDTEHPTSLKWKKNVLHLSPYEPGKPIEQVKREFGLKDVIKLASNENPLGPSKKVEEVLRAHAGEVRLYPDSSCHDLLAKLSQKLGVPPDMLVAGCGSVEIIKWVFDTLVEPQDEVVMGDVTFPLYALLCTVHNAVPVMVPVDSNLDLDLDLMLASITPKTKVVFIATPNNPTGKLVNYSQLEKFVAQIPQHILAVIDVAYIEYVGQDYGHQCLDLLQKHENILVLRTFSKFYNLAGLRVGYGIAKSEIIVMLNKVKIPFSVNLLSQLAAIAALDDEEYAQAGIEINEQGKAYLYKTLDEMKVRYYPTFANFILLDTGKDSEETFQALQKRGVIVRPMRQPRIKTCLRVTIGTMEQNRMFIEKLKEVL